MTSSVITEMYWITFYVNLYVLRKHTIKMTTVFFEYTSTFNLGEWSLNSLLKYSSKTLFYEVSSSKQGGQCVCITPYFFS